MKEPTYNGLPFSHCPAATLQRVIDKAHELEAVAGPHESVAVSKIIAAKMLRDRTP